MDPWSILGIAPTRDEGEILRAYARRLKQTRPEQDPEAFQRLVQARTRALNWHWPAEPVPEPDVSEEEDMAADEEPADEEPAGDEQEWEDETALTLLKTTTADPQRQPERLDMDQAPLTRVPPEPNHQPLRLETDRTPLTRVPPDANRQLERLQADRTPLTNQPPEPTRRLQRPEDNPLVLVNVPLPPPDPVPRRPERDHRERDSPPPEAPEPARFDLRTAYQWLAALTPEEAGSAGTVVWDVARWLSLLDQVAGFSLQDRNSFRERLLRRLLPRLPALLLNKAGTFVTDPWPAADVIAAIEAEFGFSQEQVALQALCGPLPVVRYTDWVVLGRRMALLEARRAQGDLAYRTPQGRPKLPEDDLGAALSDPRLVLVYRRQQGETMPRLATAPLWLPLLAVIALVIGLQVCFADYDAGPQGWNLVLLALNIPMLMAIMGVALRRRKRIGLPRWLSPPGSTALYLSGLLLPLRTALRLGVGWVGAAQWLISVTLIAQLLDRHLGWRFQLFGALYLVARIGLAAILPRLAITAALRRVRRADSRQLLSRKARDQALRPTRFDEPIFRLIFGYAGLVDLFTLLTAFAKLTRTG